MLSHVAQAVYRFISLGAQHFLQAAYCRCHTVVLTTLKTVTVLTLHRLLIFNYNAPCGATESPPITDVIQVRADP